MPVAQSGLTRSLPVERVADTQATTAQNVDESHRRRTIAVTNQLLDRPDVVAGLE